MWFKGSTIGAGLTDAWLFNYGVGIGSTQVPNGVRLAAGNVQFTQNDLAVVRDINASGIGTIPTLSGTTATYTNGNFTTSNFTTGNIVTGVVTNLTSTNATLTNINSSGISTLGVTSVTNLTAQQLNVSGVITATTFYGTFSGNASSATYATSSGIATYANNAGIATYSTSAGIATYATNAGIATSAGIATYATSAGIATSVIGGIGSITQLQVTGISTFTNGPVLIGTGTATGTSSQPLQVTGGAYVSGNLGVGITNTSNKLEVIGGNVRFATASQGDIQITHSNLVSTIKGGTTTQLALGAGSIDAIRINTSGSVGIGTTNPTSKLHVIGDVRITGISTFTDGPVFIGAATSTGTASQRLQVTGGAYIRDSVGIGTTNPQATLQVKDALAFETTNTTTTSTTQVAVDTFATATFRSAKYQVQMTCPGQIATLGGITTGGSGYTAGTFNVGFTTTSGTGSAAQGTLVVSNGTIGQIGIGTTGGSGYVAGDVLTASGGSGFQVSVGTTSATGAILTLGSITSAGIGYTAGVGVGTTTITFLGGTGTGAVGLATIYDGVITSSTLLQQPTTGTGGTVYYSGSNYSTASVLSVDRTTLTNTIITIAGSVGVSTFTSLTAHGIGVSDVVRVSSTSNGLTAGSDYYVVTVPDTTSFTLGTAVGVGITFTAGTSLSIGFYRNSANAGGAVTYTNAITGVSTNYQVSDLMVLQNGTTADFVEYATIANNDILGTFASDISGANARLLVTPTYPNNTIKVVRQAITL